MYESSDTIFAFASGSGKSAVSVLRISGARCSEILAGAMGGTAEPRRATLRLFRDPETGDALDQVIVLWFPAPRSFTGEEGLEVHCHGGLGVRNSILSVVSRFVGCRHAEPGEFTLRAFQNGKMDLGGVEGLAELLDAKTRSQIGRAMGMIGGGLAGKAAAWRGTTLELLASLSAVIDFSDEGDVQDFDFNRFDRVCAELIEEVSNVVSSASKSEILRTGFKVALCGNVNVGKSSLLNVLAKRDAAIVSAEEGTTRDIIEVELDLDGVFVRVFDTAGFRETDNVVELLGIDRSVKTAADADLVLWLSEDGRERGARPWVGKSGQLVVPVRTKIDLVGGNQECEGIFGVSSVSGRGIDALLSFLSDQAGRHGGGGEDSWFASARQLLCLELVLSRLNRVCSVSSLKQVELIAEEVSCAATELAKVVGIIEVEDVLGEVFSRFCIGK
jgi:tRNA modification GTPase